MRSQYEAARLPDSECILYGSETFSGTGKTLNLKRGIGKDVA